MIYEFISKVKQNNIASFEEANDIYSENKYPEKFNQGWLISQTIPD